MNSLIMNSTLTQLQKDLSEGKFSPKTFEDFVSTQSNALHFIGALFPTVEHKRSFIDFTLRYVWEEASSAKVKEESLSNALNVLRLLCRENVALEKMISEKTLWNMCCFVGIVDSDEFHTKDLSFSPSKDAAYRCIINILHQSEDMRRYFTQNIIKSYGMENLKKNLLTWPLDLSTLNDNSFDRLFYYHRILFYSTFESSNGNLMLNQYGGTLFQTLLNMLEEIVNLKGEELQLMFKKPNSANFIQEALKVILNLSAHHSNDKALLEATIHGKQLRNFFLKLPSLYNLKLDVFETIVRHSTQILMFSSPQFIVDFFLTCQEEEEEEVLVAVDTNCKESELETKEQSIQIETNEEVNKNHNHSIIQENNEKKEQKAITRIVNARMLLMFISLFIEKCTDETKQTTEVVPLLVALESAAKHSNEVKTQLKYWLLRNQWPSYYTPQLTESALTLIKKDSQTPPAVAPVATSTKKTSEGEANINYSSLSSSSSLQAPKSDLLKENISEKEVTSKESGEQSKKELSINEVLKSGKEEDGENQNINQNKSKVDIFDAPDKDVNPVKALFIHFMTSTNYNLKSYVSEFLFTLCDENSDTFAREIGIGNAIGLMAEKGLLGNILGNK